VARLSCFTESMHVGKTPIVKYCQGLVQGVIPTSLQIRHYRYEKRLEEEDLFPVFVIGESLSAAEESGKVIKVADSFIRKHQKALYGIVAGEPRYDDFRNLRWNASSCKFRLLRK